MQYVVEFGKDTQWRIKPTVIDFSKTAPDYMMFIDENNTISAFNSIIENYKNNGSIDEMRRFLTVTGCIFTAKEYDEVKENIKNLKLKYWENGEYIDKGKKQPVVLHSNLIRTRKYPFDKKNLNLEEFHKDLDSILKTVKCKIISITIDAIKYYEKNYKLDPYNICISFIMERFIYFAPNNKKLIIIFEGRGEKEDKDLLSHINKIYDGDIPLRNIPAGEIRNKFYGFYFNTKVSEISKHAYPGLEIVDMFSYPIHKYIRNGFVNEDKFFKDIVEPKIDCYPNYTGRGVKIFP